MSIAARGLEQPGRGRASLQGASTITQQTVKSLLLTPERTYTRKIRELVLARRLEQRFTKDEILFLYLNQIYFGTAPTASRRPRAPTSRRKSSDLTVAEAAHARRHAEGAGSHSRRT